MSKKKFIFVLFICALSAMIPLLLCTCNDNAAKETADNDDVKQQDSSSPSDDKQDTFTEDRSKIDDLGDFNFDGYDYKIYNWISPDDFWFDAHLDYEEIEGEPYHDSVYIRNRAIESRFNIDISITVYEGAGNASIRNLLLSGDATYDLYSARGQEAFSFAQEGLIHSINEFEHIDLSKAYWDDFINDQITIMNKKFFAIGSFDFASLDYACVMVVNKQLLQQYGLGNPFELVKDGKWTFDTFTEMAKVGSLDIDGDAKFTDKDAWGYVARSSDVLPGFWVGGAVTASAKDDDDIPQNMMGTERFFNVIDKIFDMLWGNNIYNTHSSSESVQFDMFINGNVLFNDINFHLLKKLRGLDTDFGILPYPKLDEAQNGYFTRLGGIAMYFAPKVAAKEDLSRTSVVLEAMACESLKSCLPAYYDIVLKTKLARDVESEEIIDMVVANRVVDWVDNMWVVELRDGLLATMFKSKTNTLISLNESKIENIFNNKRDAMVNAFLTLEN